MNKIIPLNNENCEAFKNMLMDEEIIGEDVEFLE